ncbi:hypothetical protein AB833_30565 [Chromatiales bacterium (ex Bugula neritina AB1)]|nr:hypothetical protein AB833_30565 [Chromatiales bacterium (ex Bugula neritina AB1)]
MISNTTVSWRYRSQSLISVALLGVGFFQLIHLHLQVKSSGLASISALALVLVLALPKLALREKVLVSLAFLSTLFALLLSDSPCDLLERAGLQAAFLTAFMVLLSLLRDGAVTSGSVLNLGKFLTSRSPGRRYLAIHCGGQLLGMVLNFGALTLLGPLIQRGARSVETANETLANWREQRQLSALMRGFSWTVAWSPATVSMAITVSVVDGANLLIVCSYGLTAAAGSLLIGWLLDRYTGNQAQAALTHVKRPAVEIQGNFPWASARRLALVCLALFGFSILAIVANQSATVPALMLASPLVTVVWLAVQHKKVVAGSGTIFQRLRSIAGKSVPAGVPEAITLASAGYIGVIVVALIDPLWFAGKTGITSVAEPWLYVHVMALVPLLSNLAMPPILTVTVMGGLYSTLPFAGIDPNLLACSLSWGWALNLTASPFGGVPLILGRITGIPSTRLSWHWNGLFSVIMFLWCSGCIALLARG